MSVISLLLDQLVSASAHLPVDWHAEPDGTYVITLDNDIVLNLHEDPATNRVAMYASPGSLSLDDQIDEPGPWSVRMAGQGDLAEATLETRADPDTGIVLLVLDAHRASLDNVRFPQFLAHFVSWYRGWTRLLPKTLPNTATPSSDSGLTFALRP
jgi:hypothetical protein